MGWVLVGLVKEERVLGLIFSGGLGEIIKLEGWNKNPKLFLNGFKGLN